MKQALAYADTDIATNSIYAIIAKEGANSTYKDSLAYIYYGARNYSSCFMVCKDILSKDAYNYNKELEIRYNLIKSCIEDSCTVPALNYKPKTIFVNDITENPNDWRNKPYQDYFKKKSIDFVHDDRHRADSRMIIIYDF